MNRSQSGKTQALLLVAVLVVVGGAVAWMLTTPTGTRSNASDGDDPARVEEDAPEAGTYQGREDAAGDGGGLGRTEVDRDTHDAGGPATGRAGKAVSGQVVNTAGDPVEGARVSLTPHPGSGFTFQASMQEEAPTLVERTTGANGRFRITGLTAGENMNLWVSHPDYGPEQGPTVVVRAEEEQVLPPIVLDAGYAIRGRVTDTAGNPLPAQVEVAMQSTRAFRSGEDEVLRARDLEQRRIVELRTDGEGRFTAEHLAQGIWIVTARAEGFAANQSSPVSLIGEDRTQEVVLQLDAEYFIQGSVITQDQQPVGGARIRVSRTQPRPSIGGSAISSPDGSFQIRGLPQGTYSLVCEAEGYTHTRMGRVEAGGPDLRLIMMEKGGVNGRVTDTNGRPVTAFELEVMVTRRNSKQYGSTGKTYRFQDPQGDYEITDLDPGTYVLLARAEGYAPTYSPAFNTQREDVQGIDIRMKRGGKVTGVVIDHVSDDPVAGVQVNLRGMAYDPAAMDSLFGAAMGDPDNVPVTTTTTDAEGRFTLNNAYPGSVQLEFVAEDFLTQLLPVVVQEGGTADVGVVRLFPGGTIVGTAVDENGDPLAGGTVNLTKQEAFFHRSQVLDARGRFTFSGLEAGTYELVAFPPYDQGTWLFPPQSGKKAVYVREGGEVEVELVARE